MTHVLYDVDENICTITMDRPDVRNAVDGPMAAELREAFQQFEEDESLAVAVLTGNGGTFCAGADLSAVDDPERRNELDPEGLGTGPMGPSRMELTKPVIAAVAGHAVAGGLELALLADLRVVEEDAVFGVFCRRWGVPLIDGGTVRLPRVVGHARALDMILTGRPVGAAEALSWGLADRVVPAGAARAAAEALAAELAALPPTCLRSDRASVYEQAGLPLAEAMAVELRYGMATLASGEAAAGAARFAGGRGRHGAG